MKFKKLTDQALAGKRVLIRVDMNVPVKNGVIGDDTRIRASLPSILHCLKAGASVILMTHLGRPTEGEPRPEDSLAPVARRLSELLAQEVRAQVSRTIADLSGDDSLTVTHLAEAINYRGLDRQSQD